MSEIRNTVERWNSNTFGFQSVDNGSVTKQFRFKTVSAIQTKTFGFQTISSFWNPKHWMNPNHFLLGLVHKSLNRKRLKFLSPESLKLECTENITSKYPFFGTVWNPKIRILALYCTSLDLGHYWFWIVTIICKLENVDDLKSKWFNDQSKIDYSKVWQLLILDLHCTMYV